MSFKKKTYKGFMDNYPILFRQRTLPMNETCMCWGIECPPGWKSILSNLCDQLELINITYGKTYKFKIEAVQVKEKFGTLRFYYVIVPNFTLTSYVSTKINCFLDFLKKKYVKVNPDYKYDENSKYYVENIVYHIIMKLKFFNGYFLPDFKYQKIIDFINTKVRILISNAEELTSKVCADCGTYLNDNNRVETKGWINFVCKHCNEEREEENSKRLAELEEKLKKNKEVKEL